MTSNVDMPIPVPDVAGADAGYEGPDRADLTARQRLIVDSSAIADIGLRTAIATLVGASMPPTVLPIVSARPANPLARHIARSNCAASIGSCGRSCGTSSWLRSPA
ncbi:hypothetical protein MSAR_19910 [Mycolicibacterium sarraceniae]|uniref:Uncharacterized protein n=1 Tax=Mycolicibacterium sarraceniae TaxID=1534348 RepID=A0A7I7SS13_9MYCO|nr:hypothetical protein MSAR_19910 [Mycolicibacterium sarraceniae]